MSNPPPVRPWLRLASLRPITAPAPAPAPESRPPVALPTFRTASAPPSPHIQPSQPSEHAAAPAVTAAQFVGAADRASAPSSPAKKVSAPSASLSTSPLQKVTTSSSVPSSPPLKASQPPTTSYPDKTASTARVATPTKSPKTTKPAVQSPKHKLVTPPPSPLDLPPSQLKNHSEIEPRISVEAEPKTVLVQKTMEKPKQWLNGNGALQRESGETRKHGIDHHEKQITAREIGTKGKGIHRKLSDSEDSGMRVITIAGENRGASMEVFQSSKKHEFGDKPNYLHKKGNSKIKTDGSESENSGSGEGNANRKDKSHKGRTLSSLPMTAYMNSNVQCVNNSLLLNASCSHHDPGVHLSLSKKPFGEGLHLKERVDDQHK